MLRGGKPLDCIQAEEVRATMRRTELQMMVIVKTSTCCAPLFTSIPLFNDRRLFFLVTAVVADDDHNNN